MQVINISAFPSQEFTVVLDGQECTISLYTRLGKMYLDLTAGAIPICAGAICQYGTEILQSRNPGFKGTLYFWDNEGTSAPAWEGIGTRYFLLYASDGEELPERLQNVQSD